MIGDKKTFVLGAALGIASFWAGEKYGLKKIDPVFIPEIGHGPVSLMGQSIQAGSYEIKVFEKEMMVDKFSFVVNEDSVFLLKKISEK